MADSGQVYSATYSSAPVYELIVTVQVKGEDKEESVMRRRGDDWINATHILKVAGMDKPTRTRILEKECQKGTHEKIQGGYGKFQGTWLPLPLGRHYANKYNVFDKLQPILDYLPGDKSPPPAPRHHTAASNKPKVTKANTTKKAPKLKTAAIRRQPSEEQYDDISAQLNDDDTPDNSTISPTSIIGDHDVEPRSLKRKRDLGYQDYSNALLDYFMLSSSEDAHMPRLNPPAVPDDMYIDRPIDDQGHTSLHWACSMGDIPLIKEFLTRGASLETRNYRGETPLIRAILFTNNFNNGTMPRLLQLLGDTFHLKDNCGSTGFHHAAMMVSSHNKKKCAHHYIEVLLHRVRDRTTPQEFENLLNQQDHNGDTALHIVARLGAKKCVRTFIGYGVRGDIPNYQGKTADMLIQRMDALRRDRHRLLSSSPLHSDPINGIITKPGLTTSHYETQAARSFSETFAPIFAEKSSQMAQAIEDDMREKEASLADGNHLLQEIANKRSKIKQTTLHLMADNDTANDEGSLLEECTKRKQENESIFEQRQHRNIHALVRAEEAKSSVHHTNGVASSDKFLIRKYQAALLLNTVQQERKLLAAQIIEAQALAGMSEKGEVYKMLVARAMDVPREKVPEMVPEVLEELEMNKMEGEGRIMGVSLGA